jgi:4-methylaminobutanoate oxidase (formaldehyde-forming)
MALAKGATLAGARVVEGVPVTGIRQRAGRATGVRTKRGDIAAEYVVNCTGMWARQLGEEIGITVPNQAAEHYYLITERIPDLPPRLPVLEDPASYGYFREESGGLLVGLFEPVCAPWKVEGIPADFAFGEIEPDWDRMAPYLETAMARVPVTLEAGVKKFFCGPESFTPDLRPIVGEAPELKNYFVAAGLNSIGILTGGGIGRLLAHWIVTGTPDMDVTGINIDRLHRYQSNPEYRRARTIESLGLVYRCHYPTMTPETARGVKRSAVHDRLAAAGAYFRDVSGWEGADWYAPPGHEPKVEKPSWGRENWFPWWAAEHRAAREGAILMDMSFMSKFLVQGRDAGRVLNYISANDVDGETGTITYTQWLNETGLLEADLTVTKLDPERFLVVVTDTMHRHAETWLRRHIPAGAHAFVTDVTSGYCQLNVQGPRSRELLQAVTSADLSNEAFPFRTAREIDIGFARVLSIRITYVGELGYELYIPTEQAVHVYERLVEAGQGFGLRHAGLKALASLRIEKGYRDYGHDIDNTDNAFETGLGMFVDFDKPGGFIGREAALRQKAAGVPKRRLVQVLVKDPKPLLFHAEPVRRNGKPVGYVRAGSYGHTLGSAVGLAMVEAGAPIDAAWLNQGRWEVDIAGKLYPATVSLRPLYDPRMERVKG